MLSLKLPQHLILLLFVTCRLPHLLLPLIIHHFLHHSPRLPIQISQLAVFGRDLRGVDFVGCVRGYRVPPLHLVDFVEVDADFFAERDGFKRPC